MIVEIRCRNIVEISCRIMVDISCRIMVVGSKSPKKNPGFFFLKFYPNILEIKVNNKNKDEEEKNRL